MLGLPTSLPIWIAPAALARLGHPDGEMNLARAAGAEGILQGVRSKYRLYFSYYSGLQAQPVLEPYRLVVTRHALSQRSPLCFSRHNL